jgi:hypothetical protein
MYTVESKIISLKHQERTLDHLFGAAIPGMAGMAPGVPGCIQGIGMLFMLVNVESSPAIFRSISFDSAFFSAGDTLPTAIFCCSFITSITPRFTPIIGHIMPIVPSHIVMLCAGSSSPEEAGDTAGLA